MQILIVEDEAISRKTLTMYVRSMGYNALAAGNGRAVFNSLTWSDPMTI